MTNSYLDTGMAKLASSADYRFLVGQAETSVAEAMLGRFAETHASKTSVKSFASRTVEDHANMDRDLEALAVKQRMTLPNTMDGRDQAVYDKLQDERGAKFDKIYVKALVKDHQQEIKELKREVSKGKVLEIRQLAEQLLPQEEQHLSLARAAEAQMKAGS
jgi:putative membrane protein